MARDTTAKLPALIKYLQDFAGVREAEVVSGDCEIAIDHDNRMSERKGTYHGLTVRFERFGTADKHASCTMLLKYILQGLGRHFAISVQATLLDVFRSLHAVVLNEPTLGIYQTKPQCRGSDNSERGKTAPLGADQD